MNEPSVDAFKGRLDKILLGLAFWDTQGLLACPSFLPDYDSLQIVTMPLDIPQSSDGWVHLASLQCPRTLVRMAALAYSSSSLDTWVGRLILEMIP